ncbi:hypothetical protein V6246_08140 [Algibacter sp. TI.3.09]|uniref:hypothetical protein n=1 Tax=Algibacter sp. TI.3.09 TaxID=3121298 RepID=UPI00311FF10E
MLITKKIPAIKKSNVILKKYFLLLFCFISLISCVSVKPTSSKSAKNLYETFFTGEEGTQYFIKPLKFESNSSDLLYLDITFKHKKIIKDSGTLNFSVLNNNAFNDIDSLIITNGETPKTIKDINFLFSEKTNKEYKSRFSGKLPLEQVKSLFINPNWKLTLYKKENKTEFIASKKSKKSIGKLYSDIFNIF